MRRALIPTLLLMALTSACIHDNQAVLHRDAQVVATQGGDFMIRSGDRTVLELNRFEGRFFADAASGFDLYLELDSRALVAGRTLAIPGDGALCHVWILDAPKERATDQCSGSIHVLASDDDHVVAKLQIRADDSGPAWSVAERHLTFLKGPANPALAPPGTTRGASRE